VPERRPILLAVGDDAETLRTLTRDLRAVPCTDWLAGTLEREERGHLLTGPDLGRRTVSDGNGSGRDPYLLETSGPGCSPPATFATDR
jgi:hypothetical protein